MYETTVGHKYQVGDEVWWINPVNEIFTGKVHTVRFSSRCGVSYLVMPPDEIIEELFADEIYPTAAAVSAASTTEEA